MFNYVKILVFAFLVQALLPGATSRVRSQGEKFHDPAMATFHRYPIQGEKAEAALPPAPHSGQVAQGTLDIPAGRAIVVDGKMEPGEWSDAGSIEIQVEPDWKVKVWFKHDATNLYFAFQGLVRGKRMRYPEFLINPLNVKSKAWRRGDWWLHSSFNLCEGDGDYNVYERNGIFQCAKTKPGWSANHFPLGGSGVMEVRISFAKLGIVPHKGARFGLAIDLTDTRSHWTFWPATAELAHPNLWGTAELQ